MKEKLRLTHLLLLLPLLAVAFWVAQRARETREDPAAVLKALRAVQEPSLPSADDAHAISRGEVRRFDPETLYEYIDGAADAYLARGFTSCVVATFTFSGGELEDAEADAEVYRFQAAAGARAQLEAERPVGADAVAGLEDTWTDGTVLVALSGTDYLKVTSFGSREAMAERLEVLAATWRKGTRP